MIDISAVRKLLARRPMNARQLAQALGVSVPTVWRLAQAMRRAGIPVAATRDRSGWRYSIAPPRQPRIPRGLPWIPRRAPDANKTDAGRVGVVAGSYGMAGAAILCCRAAHRTGAGLVYLAAPASIYIPLASALVETVIRPMQRRRASDVLQVAERCDVIAIGPGLGLADETIELVDGVLRKFNRPVVADADAINALAKRWVPRKAPLILTPHEGELSRLIGLPAEVIRKDRERVAVETARKLRAILVLKGRGTIVTDGARTYVNPTGNPAMATAGSGDVLTGIIAALVGQKLEPFEAAQLGVWLHGRAGDLAALERPALIAGDLIDALPRALRERSNKR